MTIDEVLGALVRLDCNPRARSQTQWTAQCPAHEDRRPSLAVGIGRDGGPLLHCYRGCQFAQIIEALDDGRRVIAEFPPIDNTPDPLPAEKWLRVTRDALTPAVADAVQEMRGWSLKTLREFCVGYHDRELILPMYREPSELVNVGRYRPGKGKVIGLKGRVKPLYHIPILGTEPCDTLWIVEGEPDALSAYELGLMAVGVPGVNNWRQEAAERFTGRRVRICMDCDRPGREAAYRIFADLVPYASDLKVVDLEPLRDDGYDLTDFLMDARAKDELPEARAYLRWLQEH